ncbi:DUF3152 domain-containing protein [Streptomyces sp. NPDC006430]|uniref:DUF3152 domain-containing protein n=1 Tax=Streptomyces sp. NPDC006430 TaxID=3154299 RepID=UPI0033BE345C
MGRHSRKGPAPAPARPAPAAVEPAAPFPYGEQLPYEEHLPHEGHAGYYAEQLPYEEHAGYYEGQLPYAEHPPYQDHVPHPEQLPHQEHPAYEGPPGGRRPEPPAAHQGYASAPRPEPDARIGGHPQQHEPGGAWGAGPEAVYGDWRGVPRARRSTAAVLDTDTPAVGFPQVTFPAPQQPAAPSPAPDPFTSTGSHRRVPGPRAPITPAASAAPVAPVAPVAPEVPDEEPAAPGRGRKARTYTTVAAVAVTTAIAVVVAVQMTSDGDKGTLPTAQAAGGATKRADSGQSAASRSDGRATPQAPAAAPELSYEQKMAQQLPIDEKLKGPGTFDTVPGVAPAPGKGKVVRYRVDVEQGLGLDPQLFAEAVHRTLNDDRSWGHGGTKSFERVPGGEADFVITLASPGTTGVWCAKSGLDTTVDNVSCDSASTERVMINAFRWAQGSPTFGADQMFAYRQMLINHEVGHRLGHGHVNCQTPGALAPIMQQQTKSLDIGGIQCKPNPWVFPGS